MQSQCSSRLLRGDDDRLQSGAIVEHIGRYLRQGRRKGYTSQPAVLLKSKLYKTRVAWAVLTLTKALTSKIWVQNYRVDISDACGEDQASQPASVESITPNAYHRRWDGGIAEWSTGWKMTEIFRASYGIAMMWPHYSPWKANESTKVTDLWDQYVTSERNRFNLNTNG